METLAGKTHTFTQRSVRYVRDYLNGSTANSGNHWTEIEVWGTATTAYVGDYFEWNGSLQTMTRYYSAGGTRVAVRNSNGSGTNGLVYLLGDHLGSASLTADPLDGDRLSELRYKAWGETRHSLTNAPTDRRYTGQAEEAGVGLYFYGSRFYDPLLSRFASPDSIIPQNQGTQAWDRYAYVNNSPVNYTDPTGHMYDDGCSTESCHTPNLVQSQRAVEDALMRNHRTWEQLPQGYQEVLGKTGWDPSTYDQSDLAKGGATDVSWSIEDPFNKLYWSVVGVTAGFEIAPLAASTGKAAIQQAIIACLMNPICQQIVPKAYSTRLEGQSDIFHNFPRLLDPIILKYGDKSINNGFVNFIIEGTVEHASKIYTGAYQIGIELQGLVPTIVHHFFKPK